MQFTAVNGKILVGQWNKQSKDKNGNPFGTLHTNSQIGIIVYLDEALAKDYPWLKKDVKVVYGKEHQAVYVEGIPLLAMDVKNILMLGEEERSNDERQD